LLIFGRVTLAIIILLLGLRMEKDFMRSITTTIFIPMMLCEIFNIYCEVVAYINLFTPTKEQYTWIKSTYVEWTHSLLYVIYNYVHYNVLVMVIMLLYCCRLAYQGEGRINAFPLNTICLVVQFIPFFLSVLYYVTDGTTEIALRILSIASRVFLIICFIVINLQILSSFLLLCMELPYTHANSNDVQVRDARSRLFWTLIYVISPYIAFIPFIG
uniref:G_PROTEIN_RECEP_F1_2 domain-containing protein n=1 Tax=Angiostrongylus cantonensis TaxID=6313 RepID=A0A0K0DIQ8_ANGCA